MMNVGGCGGGGGGGKLVLRNGSLFLTNTAWGWLPRVIDSYCQSPPNHGQCSKYAMQFWGRARKSKVSRREDVDVLTARPQNAMPVIDPPLECAEPGNAAKREWYLEQVKTADLDNFDYSERFFDTTEDLWKDKGVLECFARSNEYQERLHLFISQTDSVLQ